MAPATVTLLVPGLLGPWPAELRREIAGGLVAPALTELMRRARGAASRRTSPASDPEGAGEPWPLEGLILARAHPGYPGPVYPFAALTYAADAGGVRPDGWVLRCDPVHLHADVGTAHLLGEEHLELTQSESEALARELNRHLGEEGIAIEPLAPTRWYVRLAREVRVRAFPPSVIASREVGRFLPRGDEGRAWRRRINEVQMLLHASDVNARRQAQGRPVVNSVWFWGPGRLPRPEESPECAPERIWSAHPVVRGLAALGWANAETGPADGHDLVARLGPGPHLVVIEAAYAPVLGNDVEGWRRALAGVEDRWLAPLLDALDRGRIRALGIQCGLVPEAPVVATGPRWWPRWRRARSLPELLRAGRAGEEG